MFEKWESHTRKDTKSLVNSKPRPLSLITRSTISVVSRGGIQIGEDTSKFLAPMSLQKYHLGSLNFYAIQQTYFLLEAIKMFQKYTFTRHPSCCIDTYILYAKVDRNRIGL